MNKRHAYRVVQSRYITEKSSVLAGLHKAESNPSLKKCEAPKVVFLVDLKAKKTEIKKAVEEIYAGKNVRVTSVNTIRVKPKLRTVRGRAGYTNEFKKAIVTFRPGDSIDEGV